MIVQDTIHLDSRIREQLYRCGFLPLFFLFEVTLSGSGRDRTDSPGNRCALFVHQTTSIHQAGMLYLFPHCPTIVPQLWKDDSKDRESCSSHDHSALCGWNYKPGYHLCRWAFLQLWTDGHAVSLACQLLTYDAHKLFSKSNASIQVRFFFLTYYILHSGSFQLSSFLLPTAR